jgi:hypothetical protein
MYVKGWRDGPISGKFLARRKNFIMLIADPYKILSSPAAPAAGRVVDVRDAAQAKRIAAKQ